MLFAGSVVLLYLITSSAKLNKYSQILVVLLFILGIDHFWMIKTVLSETLTMFALVFTVYIFTLLLKTPNYFWGVIFSVSYFLLVMVRPFNIFLIVPFMVILALTFAGRMRQYLPLLLLILSLCIAPLIIYSQMNGQRFQYSGVSIEGGANIFSRLTLYPERLNDKTAYPEIHAIAKTCAPDKLNYFNCMYPLLPHGDINAVRDDSRLKIYEHYSIEQLRYNIVPYLKESFGIAKRAFTELYIQPSGLIWYEIRTGTPASMVFAFLAGYQQMLHYLFGITFMLLLPYFIWVILRSSNWPNYRRMVTLTLFAVVSYYVTVTGLVAPGDLGRMIIPVSPFLYFFLVWLAYNIASFGKSLMLKYRHSYV